MMSLMMCGLHICEQYVSLLRTKGDVKLFPYFRTAERDGTTNKISLSDRYADEQIKLMRCRGGTKLQASNDALTFHSNPLSIH